MENSKKNVAVIGYGGMGGWHTRFIRGNNVVNLIGIYDINPERAKVAEENGIHAYGSWEEVLADTAVDIVVIAVPNELHKPLAIEAMSRGKHVICEKPVTLSSADLQEIIDASHKYDRLFTTHQNRRWDVDYLMMKELYRSGELGDVFTIESRYHGSRGIPGDWRAKKEHGGGMILDWGVHLIDQMLQLIPEKIVKVSCDITNITTDEVDDGFRLNLYFESGKSALVEVGTFNFIAMPRFYMQCKNGSAKIEDWRKNAEVAKCLAWHESDVVPVQTAAGITKTMAPRDEITLKTYEAARPVSDVHDFYRNLVKAIDGTEEQLITHAQIRRVLSVMEACFKSAELGAPVDFE